MSSHHDAVPDPGADELDAEVLVVGAGPVGCWLAAELCAVGVGVMVVEARQVRSAWSRGFVVHPRTLEIFDTRGAAAALLEVGNRVPTWHFAMAASRLDFTVLPTTFPFVLLQPQARTEELLEQHLIDSGGAVLRGQRFLGLRQKADRVAVRLRSDGIERSVAVRFVVGCDGAHSAVRRAAGIGFSGNPDTMVSPTALVELADPPPPEHYMQTRDNGVFFAIPLPDGRFIVSTVDHAVMHALDAPWTAETLRASLLRITGSDYGMGDVERVSTIGNSARQADRYRAHRVLLAGDSAHVHFPMGGQGMNLGIQDAHNLAWRLTAAVQAQRDDPAAGPCDIVLDGYEAERRPVGERVLEDVRAQMALVTATGADGAALRSRMESLLAGHQQVNLEYARRLSGIDVRYPTTQDPHGGARGADVRLGTRVPDLLLKPVGANPTRLHILLREIGPGRFVRLSVTRDGAGASEASASSGKPGASAMSSRAVSSDRPPTEPLPDTDVASIAASAVLGPHWALREGWGTAESVLIRPDGHVADLSA